MRSASSGFTEEREGSSLCPRLVTDEAAACSGLWQWRTVLEGVPRGELVFFVSGECGVRVPDEETVGILSTGSIFEVEGDARF